MFKLLTAVAIGSVLVLGCSKDGGGGAKADSSGKAGAASGQSLGVAECDAYFAKWDECSAKSPAVKAVMAESVKQNRDAWKTMAATPEGKEHLAGACKAAAEALADSCK